MDRVCDTVIRGGDQNHIQEKEVHKKNKKANSYLRRLRKEEEWKAYEKRKDISIWIQSYKEDQGEIRKASQVINAKK